MNDNQDNSISRRIFLKYMGIGAIAGAASACGVKTSDNDQPHEPTGTGEMTYRVNHNTGDSVSILGYGCMRLPTQKVQIDGKEEEVIDQEELNRHVDYALAHGVNYFDTSPAYCRGKSEEAMGIALSRHPRDKYFIATKLSNFSPETWPREKSIEMFENSLRYLRTDYIDYLLLHAIGGGGMPGFDQRYTDNGILDYLVEQKEAGRIRNLGFSYHGDIEVFDTMLQWMDEGKIHWDFVQIQLNYIDWYRPKEDNPHATDAEYLYGELEKRNIPAVIMEPLLGGRLAKASDPITAKMKQRRPDDTVASWAFRFAGTPRGILTVLSGMTYMEHLQDNIRTYSSLEPLSADEEQFVQSVALEMLANDVVPCTACNYCMPCPYGVNIPAIFAHYNRCINEDHAPRTNRDPGYAASRKAFLVGYDRSVPALRQASHCIACGECVSHCPQGIPIPDQLASIDAYVSRLKAGEA